VIAGVAVLLFGGVLLGVGIHHLIRTGTCSSTGYSANYGPGPTCPSGTAWWMLFLFAGIILGLVGAGMAGSVGLVFAGIFGAIGLGSMSLLLDSHAPSGSQVFGGIFGGAFALVGLIAGGATITAGISSMRAGDKPAPASPRTKLVTNAFGPASATASSVASLTSMLRSAAAAHPMVAPEAVPTAVAAPEVVDPLDQIAKLADLHQRGALTDEEFAREKAKLLDRA
jgi:hypothetical protein